LFIQVDHRQKKNIGTKGKVLQKKPPLHNQSAKNALDILPKRGKIKMNTKNRKINKTFP
jgi:hypothetical protein